MSNYEYVPAPAPHSTPKKLIRHPDDKYVAGVLGGIAYYLGIDATVVRIVFVVLAVVGFGSIIIAYLVAWALVPMGVRVGPVPPEASPSR
ncbi:MAG: PspC domain-containing protein [Nocardioidaceae bacterium]|nr:MAG: PspC domain-containing protein [Nocardioidaceae bacterium]